MGAVRILIQGEWNGLISLVWHMNGLTPFAPDSKILSLGLAQTLFECSKHSRTNVSYDNSLMDKVNGRVTKEPMQTNMCHLDICSPHS
jgi:hypothetical protein